MMPPRIHTPSRPAPATRPFATLFASRPFEAPSTSPSPAFQGTIQGAPVRGHEFGSIAVHDPRQASADATHTSAAEIGSAGGEVIQRMRTGPETPGLFSRLRRYLPVRLGGNHSGQTEENDPESGGNNSGQMEENDLELEVDNAGPVEENSQGGLGDYNIRIAQNLQRLRTQRHTLLNNAGQVEENGQGELGGNNAGQMEENGQEELVGDNAGQIVANGLGEAAGNVAENAGNGSNEHAPLTEDELNRVANALAYGHTGFGGTQDQVRYGEEAPGVKTDFTDAACWNWALCGAGDKPVWPTYLFSALGDEGLTQPLEFHMPDSENHGRAWYVKHQKEIEDLRVPLLKTRGEGGYSKLRRRAEVPDVRKRALEMMIQANGMEVADPNEESPYSISVESERNDTVDWTHWGVGVGNHTFETNPGVGMWHTQNTFAKNWENHYDSDKAKRRYVTTVRVRGLRPEHYKHIRGMLNQNLK